MSVSIIRSINQLFQQQRMHAYLQRGRAYDAIFARVKTDAATLTKLKTTQADFIAFQKVYLAHLAISKKIELLVGDERGFDRVATELAKTAEERDTLEAILTELGNQTYYRRLMAYLNAQERKDAVRDEFKIGIIGKTIGFSFALGNAVALAIIGIMLADQLKLYALDFLIEQEGVYAVYAAGGFVLLCGAIGVFIANMWATRDNIPLLLNQIYKELFIDRDLDYSAYEKFKKYFSFGVCLISGLVGGYFTFIFPLEFLLENGASDALAYTLSTFFGVGAFLTVTIVFYRFAKIQVLSGSVFSDVGDLYEALLLFSGDDAMCANLAHAKLNKLIENEKNKLKYLPQYRDNTKALQAKAEENAKNSMLGIMLDARAKANSQQAHNMFNTAVSCIFLMTLMPAIVIYGAVFQQFSVYKDLAELLSPELAILACITAGISYMYMFVPSATKYVIDQSFSVVEVANSDKGKTGEEQQRANTYFITVRALNTVMNAIQALIGGIFVFMKNIADLFTPGGFFIGSSSTLAAGVTSHVMLSRQGEHKPIGIYESEKACRELTTVVARDGAIAPAGRLTRCYDSMYSGIASLDAPQVSSAKQALKC